MPSISINDTTGKKWTAKCVAVVKLSRFLNHYVRRRYLIAFSIISAFFLIREGILFNYLDKRPQNSLPDKDVVNNNWKSVAVVLVMAAKRERAIKNHLNQLIKLRPSAVQFPIIISQDGDNEEVMEAISSFTNKENKISFIHHKEHVESPGDLDAGSKNYFRIAHHYKWALDKIFQEMKYETAIITEDDLDLADDFFSYFAALKPILLADKTIWCISAWNDNGGANITDRKHGEKLYRTDFFPGLGWMLTAELWNELSSNWPKMYWDDWMRRQDIRKERVCIRPEVSRTSHNNNLAGKGSSGGLYKKYLASIRLPEVAVDFSKLDFSYLIKSNYDSLLSQKLSRAVVLSVDEFLDGTFSGSGPFFIAYKTPREYRRLGKSIGLMLDIRSGMPRTAYYGIVTFMYSSQRFYAAPEKLNFSVHNFGLQPSSDYYNEKWDKMTRYLEFQETYCIPTKYNGKCDPNDPNLIAWFAKKRLSKRLKHWGEMIIN
ncbi:GNT-I family protein [Onchocerca flexuosa]|uniref:Alpha-1,3-mannosyl-glycoprotein 2-beta-N-acetylglucosaminyltransferase n=1 Tax=Onchocerca flexuosa TaxID=387005 RepID=A0A238BVB4_9BILA|nr:GNT-I family protein [Onchocerca flexuosa]